MEQEILASRAVAPVPRSIGTLKLSTKYLSSGSGLSDFRTSGATKVAFPRRKDAVEGIILNTSGGLTGDDRFEAKVRAGAHSKLVLTTQAAERAYRSRQGTARVNTHLSVDRGASLHWLPQEFIVFDGASVERRLTVDLGADAEMVIVEPIVFGRRAMLERLLSGFIRETICIRKNREPIFVDRIQLDGAIDTILQKRAVAGGRLAMASVVFCGRRAEALLSGARAGLPAGSGVSLMSPDLLCARVLAEDSYELRLALVPLLELLTGARLPKSWSL